MSKEYENERVPAEAVAQASEEAATDTDKRDDRGAVGAGDRDDWISNQRAGDDGARSGRGEASAEQGMEQVDMGKPNDQTQAAVPAPEKPTVAAGSFEHGQMMYKEIAWPLTVKAEFVLTDGGKLEFQYARLHGTDGRNVIVVQDLGMAQAAYALLNAMHTWIERNDDRTNELTYLYDELSENFRSRGKYLDEAYAEITRLQKCVTDLDTALQAVVQENAKLRELKDRAIAVARTREDTPPAEGAIVEGSKIIDMAGVKDAAEARHGETFRGPQQDVEEQICGAVYEVPNVGLKQCFLAKHHTGGCQFQVP